jgi:hypothetical protein
MLRILLALVSVFFVLLLTSAVTKMDGPACICKLTVRTLPGGGVQAGCSVGVCNAGGVCGGIGIVTPGVGLVAYCYCGAHLGGGPAPDADCFCVGGVIVATKKGLCTPLALCAGDIPSDPVCEVNAPTGPVATDGCDCYLVPH